MSAGMCRMCGCTEESACVDVFGDACGWSDKDPTVCTFCEDGVACDRGGDNVGEAFFGSSGAVGFVRGRR